MQSETSPRVFLVDDEHAALLAMEVALKMAGVSSLQSFTDWNDALGAVSTAKPDVVVLDIIMPQISGVEALRMCRKKYPLIPVIMATGVDEVASAVECMKLGAADYLVKPLSPQHFVTCVRNVLLESELTIGRVREPEGGSGLARPKTATEKLASFEKLQCTFAAHVNSSVPPEQYDLFERVFEFLVTNKEYTNKNITLEYTARSCKTNTSYLSSLINTAYDMNFRTLVNNLRIGEFVRLVQAPESSKFSIEAICEEIGFTRKATFYKAFNAIVGMTPGKWIERLSV